MKAKTKEEVAQFLIDKGASPSLIRQLEKYPYNHSLENTQKALGLTKSGKEIEKYYNRVLKDVLTSDNLFSEHVQEIELLLLTSTYFRRTLITHYLSNISNRGSSSKRGLEGLPPGLSKLLGRGDGDSSGIEGMAIRLDPDSSDGKDLLDLLSRMAGNGDKGNNNNDEDSGDDDIDDMLNNLLNGDED